MWLLTTSTLIGKTAFFAVPEFFLWCHVPVIFSFGPKPTIMTVLCLTGWVVFHSKTVCFLANHCGSLTLTGALGEQFVQATVQTQPETVGETHPLRLRLESNGEQHHVELNGDVLRHLRASQCETPSGQDTVLILELILLHIPGATAKG